MNEENRKLVFNQRFISDITTICKTKYDNASNGPCRARIRINKADPRVKLTYVLVFEPTELCRPRSGFDQPNTVTQKPGDTASARKPDAALDMRGESKIGIGLQMLCNRTPVTFKQLVGNRNMYPPPVNTPADWDINDSGLATINARGGNYGFATEISDDCDFVSIDLVLYAAQSAEVDGVRETGRWLMQYRLTAMERLSREEWDTIVSQTNMTFLYRNAEEIQ